MNLPPSDPDLFCEQGADDEAMKRMKAVRAAVTKLEKLLYEEEW